MSDHRMPSPVLQRRSAGTTHAAPARQEGASTPAGYSAILGHPGEGVAPATLNSYRAFIASKGSQARRRGFAARDLPESLFGHQRHMVDFACEAGSAACMYDTGLGKTAVELAWADQVRRQTGKPVLIKTPLAVASQVVEEAARVGIDSVRHVLNGDDVRSGEIAVTNYERLHLFRPEDFGGVVLDESSILKSFAGKTTRRLIKAFAEHPYRLAATATPAPNDHMEIGQHSEFLGVMPAPEMLSRWFIVDHTDLGRYRLKGHAVRPFWRWVASWAQAARLPSDVGPFDDAGYDLPPFELKRHLVRADVSTDTGGLLFRIPSTSATSIHKEKRLTVDQRADLVSILVASEPGEPWVVWVDTDYEADAVMARIPEAVEVRGGHSLAQKERALTGFSDGSIRVLVTKPRIAGFGLNWQHCARTIFAGVSFSYEAFYQAIRRFWRFGQLRRVDVHAVLADTELAAWASIQRKRSDHDEMSRRMVAAMREAGQASALRVAYDGRSVGLPSFLTGAAAQ